MDKQNIDKLFKKIVDSNQEFHKIESDRAKNKIWNEIQKEDKTFSYKLWFKISAAAAVILLITSTILFQSLNQSKRSVQNLITTNNLLNHKIAEKQNLVINTPIDNPKVTTNTIVEVKKEIIYRAVEKIVKIKDTVYIPKIVYLEKPSKNNNQLSTQVSYNDSKELKNNSKTEFIIDSKKSNKRKKVRNLKIQFRRKRNQTTDSETFAFSTNL